MTNNNQTMEGGCACGEIRYRIHDKPLFVHCCHCRRCQRETGTGFGLNAMIEADKVELLQGQPQPVMVPTDSGKGQKISRCPSCQVSVWSNYGGAGDLVHFVRVGSLDRPDLVPPDIHIFTEFKQPWVVIPDGVVSSQAFYKRGEVWPAASLQRAAELAERYQSK